jgi:hypothetical protein
VKKLLCQSLVVVALASVGEAGADSFDGLRPPSCGAQAWSRGRSAALAPAMEAIKLRILIEFSQARLVALCKTRLIVLPVRNIGMGESTSRFFTEKR